MPRLGFSASALVRGDDLSRPRLVVERDKLAHFFPGFKFYGSSNKVNSIQGTITTSYGNAYRVKIDVPDNYPYVMPQIWLPGTVIDPLCPHRYTGGDICVMKSSQWSATLSLASLVTKAAVWLNKYDKWLRDGRRRWPGNDQHRP
jgi:ubiquitin-protein ligase